MFPAMPEGTRVPHTSWVVCSRSTGQLCVLRGRNHWYSWHTVKGRSSIKSEHFPHSAFSLTEFSGNYFFGIRAPELGSWKLRSRDGIYSWHARNPNSDIPFPNFSKPVNRKEIFVGIIFLGTYEIKYKIFMNFHDFHDFDILFVLKVCHFTFFGKFS